MTSDELEQVSAIERDVELAFRSYPSLTARVRWLCAFVRRQDSPESVVDDRDKVLKAQSERIAELEIRLGLTAEAVLEKERAELDARTTTK
jgi:hypothetical protein